MFDTDTDAAVKVEELAGSCARQVCGGETASLRVFWRTRAKNLLAKNSRQKNVPRLAAGDLALTDPSALWQLESHWTRPACSAPNRARRGWQFGEGMPGVGSSAANLPHAAQLPQPEMPIGLSGECCSHAETCWHGERDREWLYDATWGN